MDRRIIRQGNIARIIVDQHPFKEGEKVKVVNTDPYTLPLEDPHDDGPRRTGKRVAVMGTRFKFSFVQANPHCVRSANLALLYRILSTRGMVRAPLGQARYVQISYNPGEETPYSALLLTEGFQPVLSLPDTTHLRDLIEQEREYRKKAGFPGGGALLPGTFSDLFEDS